MADREKDGLGTLPEDIETVFRIIHEMDPDGLNVNRLVVERRTIAPAEPALARSPARAHVFHEAGTFVQYLDKYGSPNTVLLADFTRFQISAVLDEVAKSGREVVRFTPQFHPLWRPWNELLGEVLPLNDLLDFLRANRRSLHPSQQRDLILTLSQVRAATSRELHVGTGKQSLNGLLVRSTIQGETKTEVVDLPETINVQCPVFVGDPDRTIELDLILNVEGEGTAIVASIASGGILAAQVKAFEDAFDQMCALRELTNLVVVYGEEHCVPWPVV